MPEAKFYAKFSTPSEMASNSIPGTIFKVWI